jgi:two-component system response regulator AtoC
VNAGRRILVVDDEESLRHMLGLTLSKAGYHVWTAASAEEGLEALRKNEPFDLCLSDIRMPGMDGLTFVEQGLRVAKGQPTFIAMSAYGDEQMAVEALRRGAFDYVSKPFEGDDLLVKLRLVSERRRLQEADDGPAAGPGRATARPGRGLDDVLSVAPAMQAVFRTVRKVADFPTTVLITGETGTGKERIASALHQEGRRAGRAFVAVNCAAIPETLLESELFGHTKGAFTDAAVARPGLFEAADGGTLFLDEVAELPTTLQVKLLRALVEREVRRVGDHRTISVDARVIAATSRDLEAMVKEGGFRRDLFYRLNVVSIHLPPLRDRTEDVPVLAQHFVERLGRRLDLPQASIDADALAVLESYPWPGNVRELENAIERALVLAEHQGRITAQDLDGRFAAGTPMATEDLPLPAGSTELSLKVVLPKVERALIRRALEKTRGNRSQAASLLGISQRALLYKLKEYEIS